uniref:protein-tyrosine-phosphatase n=2 Tax=Meloidogyne javanica TaxID=6303 RepID=A0A915LMA6_MELJA
MHSKSSLPLFWLCYGEFGRCTAVYGTPTMFIDMLGHEEYPSFDYSSIHSGIVAGAPCPVTLCSRLVNELGMKNLQVCYGTTETSPVSFMSICDDPPEERIRNVGHIMDHLEAAIVDADGKIVPRGQRGDLLIRGYSLMYGYWDNEEATRAVIGKDRWYRSGDIGVMNENGTVSIVGRYKDMIIRGGENIYPTEVEQFIDKHPAVADVQVTGKVKKFEMREISKRELKEFIVRPSESSASDYTLSIHRGTRVTHVKIVHNPLSKTLRLPSGHDFHSVEAVVQFLEANPKVLTEADGLSIELTKPAQLPIAETVVNVGSDRFFHIATSGHEAEALLKDEPCGTYLVRESCSNEGEFALSVRSNTDKVVHVRISHKNGRFCIVPKDNFRTLAGLVENYIRLPMVQNGGSAVKLKTPLPSTRFTAATIDDRIDCLLKQSKKHGAKDEFAEEFENLHRHEEDSQLFISCKEGRKAENVRKNRYRNVVPFDHTRIRLQRSPSLNNGCAGGGGGKLLVNNDYINANYVEIPLDTKRYPEFADFKRRYISTQGCLEETVSDFWQMVWQENSLLIVMVTKEVERGRETKSDDYMRRVFVLKRKKGENKANNEAKTAASSAAWEDNDACPVESVLNFLDAVNECEKNEIGAVKNKMNKKSKIGPTIVHCSAGIGRTGTFLALDIIINRIKQKGPKCVCDVQRTVKMLREQRATMVQTEAQYRFIFHVISAFMRAYRSQFQLTYKKANSVEVPHRP